MKHIPTEPVAAKIPDGVEKTVICWHGMVPSLSWGVLTSSANHLVQNEKYGARNANLAVFSVGVRLPFES